MKKIITLFAIVGFLSLSSCTVQDNNGTTVNNTKPAQAFEIKNIDLNKVTSNEYNLSGTFNFEIGGDLFDNETVLIYRLTGTVNSSTPIWQLIPRTLSWSNGDVLQYYYDFSKVDFVITAYGNYNLLNRSEFIDNQTYRVVILPSDLLSSVNVENYDDVLSKINSKDSQIQILKL
ncbi:hypothetical protein [Flavobacterium sp. 7A]|uniref:hypothetical protein n=1 Tax=Flavobacterium sp. 7A TaxID=2940571 RepID=UPI0022278965|nr:hypothetical protein [Flavobacterium sp. 7A]MCW2119255.1 hypothetical protein [Flavobacterium sp. 7A]